jgi:ABC-2 type transport system permease protein
VSETLRTQIGQLARRSVRRTLRQPAQLVPAIVVPLFIFAVTAPGLKPAALLPGFPTDSYITFALAIPFIQGALFAITNTGTDLSIDLRTGFFDRLSLTPLRGSSLIIGFLAGAVVLGLIQAVIFLSVGLAVGAHFEAGLGGVPVFFALWMLITLGFGAVGLWIGLRSRGGALVLGLYPVLVAFVFLSSILLPRNLIEADWYRQIATYNPVSYLVEAIRSLLMTGWDVEALALGFGCAAGIALIAVAAASASLRTSFART